MLNFAASIEDSTINTHNIADTPNPPNPLAGGSGIGRNNIMHQQNILLIQWCKMLQHSWHNKFWPTPTLLWSKKWSKFQSSGEKKLKTQSRLNNSSPGLTNVRFPMTGTTQWHSPTSAYAFEVRLMYGYPQQSTSSNSRQPRRFGRASSRCSKGSSLHCQMTSSSLTCLQIWCTNRVKTQENYCPYPVQFPGWSFQQNSQKISSFFLWRTLCWTGKNSSHFDALIQHELSFYDRHDAFWATIQWKTKTSVISKSGHSTTSLQGIDIYWRLPAFTRNQVPC